MNLRAIGLFTLNEIKYWLQMKDFNTCVQIFENISFSPQWRKIVFREQ